MYGIDEVIKTLRQLARTDYWQTIYSQSKETYGLQMFMNTNQFTGLQVSFVNELAFYSSIIFDVAMNEVSDIVLTDEIYMDAYGYYRNQKRKKDKPKHPTQTKPTSSKEASEVVVNQNQWVYTKVKGSTK